MAIPRPILIAILGVALIAVALVGMTRVRPAEDDGGPVAAQTATPPVESAERPAPEQRPAEEQSGAKPTATPSAAKPAAKPDDGVPTSVERALARRDVLVLVFLQGAGDDAATRDSVRGLRDRRGVTVVSADIDQLERYRNVVGELGVNQAPAVVIVRRDGKAEVHEGFIDAGTLEQEVRDAR